MMTQTPELPRRYRKSGRLWAPEEPRIECIGGVAGGSYAARGMASAGEWSSASLPGLVADFDARFLVNVHGGDIVGTWTASRGFSYFFDAGTSDPRYSSTAWVTANGRQMACVTTDVDDLACTNSIGGINLANRLWGGNDQPGTLYLVLQMLTVGTDDYVVCGFNKIGQAALNHQCIHLTCADTTDHFYRNRKRADNLSNKIVSSGLGLINTSKHVFSWRSSGTDVEQRRDNSVIASGDWDVATCTFDRVQLSNSDGGGPTNARFARAIFYSVRHTDAQVDAAWAGLSKLHL